MTMMVEMMVLKQKEKDTRDKRSAVHLRSSVKDNVGHPKTGRKGVGRAVEKRTTRHPGQRCHDDGNVWLKSPSNERAIARPFHLRIVRNL